ncbi:MAG: MerR family transcriptional regulator [Syntrophobacterales bacterium]|nr:MerR family transcriptional regulator [Syntrophobacterales bacterium]
MEVSRRNIMLNIDQVSKLTGVRKSTLRYWEKCFPEFLRPERTPSRRREYTAADLDIIDTIKRLLTEEHLTNQGVRLHLKQTVTRTSRPRDPEAAEART